MRVGKNIMLGCVGAFAAIQLIRPAKNDSPIGADHLATLYPPPPKVAKILEMACYDCHSNRTRYPWYAQIQPVGWWLASHINGGKGHLNFSEFAAYSEHRRAKKLEAISDEVTGHSMPLKSYTWSHRDAALTEAQIKTLATGRDRLRRKLSRPNEHFLQSAFADYNGEEIASAAAPAANST